MTDPNSKRRLFTFVHRVLAVTHQPGDDYRASFGLGIKFRRQLMAQFSRILLASDGVMRARLAVLRQRRLLPPKPRRPRLRDRMMTLFPVPTPASTAPA